MIQSRCAVDSLEKKKRHRIFGLCTDGEDFRCLEIDSGLNWSRLHLTYSNDLQQILKMLAFIHFCVSCRLPAEKDWRNPFLTERLLPEGCGVSCVTRPAELGPIGTKRTLDHSKSPTPPHVVLRIAPKIPL
ncbi:uncharacterized protein N7515_003902 [Penicillium bovifimosum]|uniref:Uncharacterized protein n=1 Tax=Penicillium bovifimosum TaxID=126998 RepID=A0A9W9H775_9EURO|nr:uncharacterized protein N7515_003902 [Penicillium bovifimosum]KAJ5139054.1 hypothetical protein N7515_003902 [Penicillium bovifimosum]